MKENRIVITRMDANKLSDLIAEARFSKYRNSTYLNDLAVEVERAQLVDARDIPKDIITMNTQVELRDLDSDEKEIYTLVYPDDSDIKERKISVLAPVGTAMLGYRVGDVFEWQTPGGKCSMKVERIIYQPEASGDYYL